MYELMRSIFSLNSDSVSFSDPTMRTTLVTPKANTPAPKIMTKIAKKRPPVDTGTTSPKPTVVIVMIAQ